MGFLRKKANFTENVTAVKSWHRLVPNENVSGDAVLWRHNKSRMANGRHFEDR